MAATQSAPKHDFNAVFARAKSILAEHAKDLDVAKDEPKQYMLNSKKPHKGKELFFGGAAIHRGFVSVYLFPVYMFPEVENAIPPALKRRMKGKSCFNFTKVEEPLFADLAKLAARGLAVFRDKGLL